MSRYFLTIHLVLALAYGVHGASIGGFLSENYDKILIAIGSFLVIGAILYTAAYCMEGMIEVLVNCLRCFWICLCCCCFMCEEKEEATNNAVTESQAPTTNQPTNTTIVNIAGVTSQTPQPNITNTPMPAMSMPVNGMAVPTNFMAMPVNAMGMPCMPTSNMTFPGNFVTMPSMTPK